MHVFRSLAASAVVTLCAPSLPANSVETLRVPKGDTHALIEAVEAANNAPSGVTTQIRISGTYAFADNLALPPITSSIVLSGFGKTHTRFAGTGLAGENDQLIQVAEGGSLRIQYIDIVDFNLDGEPINEQSPLIHSLGKLDLQSVYFENVEAHGVGSPLSRFATNALIVNEGVLRMDGVSMLNPADSHSRFRPYPGGELDLRAELFGRVVPER